VKTALVTGSSGLIGSEMVSFLEERGWRVHGVDNNMRADFFGEHGDTTWNLERLRRETRRFEHHDLDVRDREGIARLVAETRPGLIVHAAAQPSHDLAAERPFDDFEVDAVGTLNLLEAARAHAPESPFAFLSTNKVYGDAPNEFRLVERETRWDYADGRKGIDESCRVDETQHSLFGASKLAAGGVYRIYGYKGKQVRDNIHASDVSSAVLAFAERPNAAAVYNLGGGRENSISVLEAIGRFEELTGREL